MNLYHAINVRDFMFLNNLEVMEGKIPSASMIKQVAKLDATTIYQALNQHQGKEQAFERIRVAEFASAPTRLGAIYCFVTEDDANLANCKWWNNSRHIVEVELKKVIAFGIYDTKHLDCDKANWENSARLYFSGQQTGEPFCEAVVCGEIYIPSWQDYKGMVKKLLPI